MRASRLSSPRSILRNTNVNSKPSFFSELTRRNVYKVVITYGVVAWFFFALLWVTLPRDAVSPVLTIYVILATLGFLLAVYISWSFEATPEGLKRTEKVPAGTALPTWSRRKYATFVIVTAALALALTVFQFVRARSASQPATQDSLLHATASP